MGDINIMYDSLGIKEKIRYTEGECENCPMPIRVNVDEQHEPHYCGEECKKAAKKRFDHLPKGIK